MSSKTKKIGFLFFTTLFIIFSGANAESNNVELLGRWPYGPCRAASVRDYLAYIANGPTFQILDIFSYPYQELSQVVLNGAIEEIQIKGDYAFVANMYEGILAINIQNSMNPTLHPNRFKVESAIGVIYPDGDYAYTADYCGMFYVLNTTDPQDLSTFLQPIGQCQAVNPGNPDAGTPAKVKVSGNYAYMTSGDKVLYVFDITDKSNPFQVATYKPDIPFSFGDFDIVGSNLYVINNRYGLHEIDVSDPTNPKPGRNPLYLGEYGGAVAVHWPYIYTGHGSTGISISDISSWTVLRQNIQVEGVVRDLHVVNNQLVIAASMGGFVLMDLVEPLNPGPSKVYECWNESYVTAVYNGYAYVGGAGGVGGEKAVRILDLNSGFILEEKGSWTDVPFGCVVQDIKIDDGMLYIITAGLHVLRLDNPVSPTPCSHMFLGGSIRRMSIKDKKIYIVYSNDDVHVIDVSDPYNPFHEPGKIDIPNNGELKDIVVVGDYGYVGDFEGCIHIIELSTKEYIKTVSISNGWGLQALDYGNNRLYAAGWFGMIQFDITNPENPYSSPGDRLSWDGFNHFTVVGKHAYLVHGMGLKLVDITQTPFPEERSYNGYFNTSDNCVHVIYQGGRIYLTCWNAGLFVCRSTINSPPDADAGPDQTFPTAPAGGIDVILDGSGSSDPDGDVLSYSWSVNTEEIATGVSPTVHFNLGVHIVTLTVDDGNGWSDTDEVIITVGTNMIVELVDSQGNAIEGGMISYYSSGWLDFGITDANGLASKHIASGKYSFKMNYAGYTQQESNVDITTTNPLVYQTMGMSVHHKKSDGSFHDEGEVQYYASGWKVFGSIAGGSVFKELLPGTYSFKMTYAGYTQQKSNINITEINPLVYQSVSMIARLQDAEENGILDGQAKYYASGWKEMGVTGENGNTPGFELLPGSYSFKMTHAGYTEQQSNIDVTATNPVVFSTVSQEGDPSADGLTVILKDSKGIGIPGGEVMYYASGWKVFGITGEDGRTEPVDLLPGKYSFKTTYEGYTQQKSSIDISATNPIEFQTIKMNVQHKKSDGTDHTLGDVQYYASGWKVFGSINNGVVEKELLPGSYSFKMTHAGYTEQKSNIDITSTKPLVYQTGEMVVRLEEENGSGIAGGSVQYYASGWKDLGTTAADGNTPGFELLPGKYSFKMTYSGDTEQKTNIDISIPENNPLVFTITGQALGKANRVQDDAKADDNLPAEYVLHQNYPNPFNPETVIHFQLPETQYVVLSIYNMLGEEICRLIDARYGAGYHSVLWTGKNSRGIDVPSGIYLYQLRAGSYTKITKMTLMR